jgi:putative peptidoglycan lipid II flippase
LENVVTGAEQETLVDTPLEAQEETNKRVARATGILALGNIMSRVLGLARVIVQTNLFGASVATDAFKTATLIPTALYDLLIAGHVNGAIIPVLSEVEAVKGRDELWRLVSVLLSIVTAALSALVLLLQLFAPQVISLFSQSDPYTQTLATDLFRITAPALVFMGLFAILSGTLYALRVFTWSALAGVIFNGTIVVVTILFVSPLQLTPQLTGTGVVWGVGRPPDAIIVMAGGWLCGAVLQMLMQIPGLRGAKLRFTLDWRHPALSRIALLYAPVMFSLIMDTLVIRPFSYILADRSGTGSISYMDYATMLIQFPQGLVATAISIAILPTLSQQAAAVSSQAFKDTLGLGLRLATTLIVPATVGLFVLATPIIALLLQHGEFTPADTATTATVLRLYLIGLPFAALDLLLVYAFYARQDTLTPALIGLVTLAVYMVVAITLQPRFGLLSLMIADSVKHILHALISAVLLHRRLNGLGGQRLAMTFGKTMIAAAVMGGAALLVEPVIERLVGLNTLIGEILVVGVSGGVCVVTFVLLAALLRIEEWRWLVGLVKRRFKL